MPDPRLDSAVERVRRRMAALGYPVVVTSGQRSADEQAKLYAQGRSTAGPVVTNAPAGHSRHETGGAADLAFVIGGKPSFADNLPWDVLGKVAKEEGLEWGGDFKSLRDRPHVQLPGQTGTTMPDRYVKMRDGNTAKIPGGWNDDQIADFITAYEQDHGLGESAPAAPTSEPGFFSRAGQNISENWENLKTLGKAVTGQLDPETGMAVAQGMMNAPKEAVAHPFKTAIRMVGGNPDTMWEDTKRGLVTGNFDPLLGDVTVPVMGALAPKVIPKIPAAAGAALDAGVRGAQAGVRGAGAVAEGVGNISGPTIGTGAVVAAMTGHPYELAATGALRLAQPTLRKIGKAMQQVGKEPSAIIPDVPTGTGLPNIRLTAKGFSEPVATPEVRAPLSRPEPPPPAPLPVIDPNSPEAILQSLQQGKVPKGIRLTGRTREETAPAMTTDANIAEPPPVDRGYMDTVVEQGEVPPPVEPPIPPSIGQLSEGNIPVGELPQSMSKLARTSPTPELSSPESAAIGGAGNRILDLDPTVTGKMLGAAPAAEGGMQSAGRATRWAYYHSIAKRIAAGRQELLDAGLDPTDFMAQIRAELRAAGVHPKHILNLTGQE